MRVAASSGTRGVCRRSQVCWRGPRVFEGPLSKAVVSKWIRFYNKYRETLTSEMLIHVRRPDGQVRALPIIASMSSCNQCQVL